MPQNHAILHSFLSSVLEEFLVRNSFAKPPPKTQPRDESARSPRKRRKLADHTVSVYSPGLSQQPNHAAELGYYPQTRELLELGCPECSGSCDGCSSCCDECLYAREWDNSDRCTPEGVHYGDYQPELQENSQNGVFNAQVCFSLAFRASADPDQSNGDMVWTDPTTGECFVVDTATGNSRPAFGPSGGNINAPRRTLVARDREGAGEDEVPSWIGEALTVRFEFSVFQGLTELLFRRTKYTRRRRNPYPWCLVRIPSYLICGITSFKSNFSTNRGLVRCPTPATGFPETT